MSVVGCMFMWVPKVTLRYYPSEATHFVFGIGSLSFPGVHHFG